MIQEDSIILDHKQIAPHFYKLTIQSKYISTSATPGQFIEIKVTDKTTPLLRKPFSIHKIDPAKQLIEILYEVLGEGTRVLRDCKVGEKLSILGPLGKGFDIDKNKKSALLIGGGIGIAPLYSLANEYRLSNIDARVYVFIGARSANALVCEQEFKDLGTTVLTSTDDGTHGKKGFISDVLLDYISNQLSVVSCPLSVIYSCGPHAMLKAVAEIASQKKIDCQMSTEAYMACGIGACKGCAVKTRSGYQMACKDGPVFDAKELLW